MSGDSGGLLADQKGYGVVCPRRPSTKAVQSNRSFTQRAGGLVAMVLFNFWLTVFSLPVYLVALLGSLLLCCAPGAQGCLSHVLIAMASLAWRATLCLCCWIRLDVEGLQALHDAFASDRPFVLLSNHTSFIDTLLSVSMLPICRGGRIRMLAANSIFRMPMIGTVVRAMGHLEVPFKETRTEDDSMEVNRDAMERQMRLLEDHLRAGKTAAWFAEGRMHLGDQREVQTFRAGGFVLPVRVDVEVWCAAFVGNSACWPPLAKAGGLPARIGCKVFRLCESSHELLAVECPEGDERARMIHLANYAHSEVQAAVTELVSRGYSPGPPVRPAADETG